MTYNPYSQVRAALFDDKTLLLPPGGNNPAGVFGQIGGALERAEQVCVCVCVCMCVFGGALELTEQVCVSE